MDKNIDWCRLRHSLRLQGDCWLVSEGDNRDRSSSVTIVSPQLLPGVWRPATRVRNDDMPILEEFLGLEVSALPWPLSEKFQINESSCRERKGGASHQRLPIKSVQCSASQRYSAKLTTDTGRFREMEHGLAAASSAQGKGPSQAPHCLPEPNSPLRAPHGSIWALLHLDPVCTAQANALSMCSSFLNLAPLLHVCLLVVCV